MQTEYIRKKDAIDVVAFGITTAKVINIETGESRDLFANENEELRKAIKRIHDLPSADVVPVVRSHWEYKCGEIRCPECGNRIHRIDLSGCLNFCPNCGAKMDG